MEVDLASEIVHVSAPGKVLLGGAYLVLERPHVALVVATAPRFHAVLGPLLLHPPLAAASSCWTQIRLDSPQLRQSSVARLSTTTWQLEPDEPAGTPSNPFARAAVELAIAAARLRLRDDDRCRQLLGRGLDVVIRGDNDFYSHRKQLEDRGLPLTSASLAALPPFAPLAADRGGGNGRGASHAPDVAKTGLGSSAAMTVAIAAGVLHYLGAINLPLEQTGSGADDGDSGGDGERQDGLQQPPLPPVLPSSEDMDLVHKVAQAAHCTAQGKVGSGFDVSAAVYGSQRYIRFSLDLLAPVLVPQRRQQQPLAVIEKLLACAWNSERTPLALPPGLVLMVGDPGIGGSSTPSMVGAVTAWRAAQPDAAGEVWRLLATANAGLADALAALHSLAVAEADAYAAVLGCCANVPANHWDTGGGAQRDGGGGDDIEAAVTTALVSAWSSATTARRLLRSVGEAAGVPVEPLAITDVLDATAAASGVLLAIVPGAGGHDAITAVVLGASPRAAVETLWASFGVLALPNTAEATGGAGLRREPPPSDIQIL
eukprot:SM000083S22735  [mRNA]  locus=s83:220124:223324:+ [translate_table: standard]